MTVQTANNKTIALGDGIATQFAFSFVGVAATYISVILTDSAGNETLLTQGSGATQYQIALNSPVQGALWGQGGVVSYNPSGTPVPTGSTLTIFRTLPLTQAVSLQYANSLTTVGSGAETGLDTLEMQLQQISETISRAILAPIVDATPPAPLPAIAQRANMGAAFDGSGNLVAGAMPASGVISSAMQPVVNAATLALGRTALGLGGIATQNIGAGLQADGSGNVRVNSPTVQVAINQTVDATFDLNRYIATGPINFTLPRANTLFNGFGFWVEAFSDDVTLVPDSHDTISTTTGSGVSFTIPAGAQVYVTTDAANTGNWYIEGLLWLTPNPRSISGNLNITKSHNTKILMLQSGAQQTVTFPSAATLPSNFRALLINGETSNVGKVIVGVGNNFGLYPGQSILVLNDNGVLKTDGQLPRWILQQDIAVYVGYNGSSDTANDGLSTSTSFATKQHAIDFVCNNIDMNRKNITVQCADGTDNTPIHLYQVTGWGTIGGHSELVIQGNMASPQNCVVSVANSNCFSMVGVQTPWRIQGFTLTVTSGVGNCISVDGNSFCYIGASMNFGACPNAHISVSYNSFVEAVGGTYTITGGAGNHVNANVSSMADMVGTQITLTGTPAFSNAFCAAAELSDVTFQLCTFVGSATGSRYSAVLNAVINTGGGGAGFLPGNVGGSTGSGGQYG